MIDTTAVTVAATATLLSGTDYNTRWQAEQGFSGSVLVQVPTGGSAVFVGGAAVTAANGISVGAGETFSLDLRPGDGLYGITASGTQAVRVLRTDV
jgi:hypothetical protein